MEKRYNIANPAVRGQSTVMVTDRALRYRAQANPPPGPEVCAYCGAAGGRLDIEHLDGHEENSEPENLVWSCRPCNSEKGAHFAAGAGRRTRQYNPRPATAAATIGQWRAVTDILRGRPAAEEPRQRRRLFRAMVRGGRRRRRRKTRPGVFFVSGPRRRPPHYPGDATWSGSGLPGRSLADSERTLRTERPQGWRKIRRQ